MTDKKNNQANLKQSNKEKKVTQAPPPITPVGDREYNTSHKIADISQKFLGPIVPITAIELMERWSIEATTLILLSYEGMLFPSFPADFRNDVNWLMVQDSKTQESFLSKCIYDKDIIEVAEIVYADHLAKVRKNEQLEGKKKKILAPTLAPQTIPLVNAEEFIQSSDDADTFIRSLRIYYVNDQEIKIGTGGKPKVYTRKALGFEKASSAWGELLKILNSSNHLYYTGKAHGAYRQRKTTYDASQKTLRFINDKIVSFLNNAYPIQLSKGFKIYEHPVSERPGMYKFKFQIINNAEEEQTAEYDQCSQSELLTIIEDLSLKHGDKNSLKLAVSIAQEKNWLGEHRAKSYLNGTIEK